MPNTMRLRNLAGRTMRFIKIIVSELGTKGQQMSEEVRINTNNLHEELLSIIRFCLDRSEEGILSRMIRFKVISDEIDEREKRLDQALSFCLKSHIGNNLLLRTQRSSNNLLQTQIDNSALLPVTQTATGTDASQREFDEEKNQWRACLKGKLQGRARVETEERQGSGSEERAQETVTRVRKQDERPAREATEREARPEAVRSIDSAQREQDQFGYGACATQADRDGLAPREQGTVAEVQARGKDESRRELDEEKTPDQNQAISDEEEPELQRQSGQTEERDWVSSERQTLEEAEGKAGQEVPRSSDTIQDEQDSIEGKASAVQVTSEKPRRKLEVDTWEPQVSREAPVQSFGIAKKAHETDADQRTSQAPPRGAEGRRPEEYQRLPTEDDQSKTLQRDPGSILQLVKDLVSHLQIDDQPPRSRPTSWVPPSEPPCDNYLSSPPSRGNAKNNPFSTPDVRDISDNNPNNPFRKPDSIESPQQPSRHGSSDAYGYAHQPTRSPHTQRSPSYNPRCGCSDYEPLSMKGGYNVNSGNVGTTIIITV